MLQQQQSSINDSVASPGGSGAPSRPFATTTPSINDSVAPPGGSGDGGQGGPRGPNPRWWQQSRGLITLTARVRRHPPLFLRVLNASIFLSPPSHLPHPHSQSHPA